LLIGQILLRRGKIVSAEDLRLREGEEMRKGNRRILLMALLVVLGLILVLYWQRSRSQVWVAFQHDEPVRSPGLFEIRCEINAIAFSPDGRFVAVGCGGLGIDVDEEGDRLGDKIRLWRTKDGRLAGVMRGPKDVVDGLAFSPDGRWLASAGVDQKTGECVVRLWDFQKGKLTHTWNAPSETVQFSPDGRWFGFAESPHRLALIKVGTWEKRKRFQLTEAFGKIKTFTFSPDAELLAVANAGSLIHLLRIADGQRWKVLRGQSGYLSAIAFSPDGQWLASGSWNLARKGELMLWGVKEGKSRRLFSGDVTCLAFSPNGRWLASGHHDGMVRVWMMPKGRLAWAWALNLRLDFFLFIPTIKREVATALAFSPDSKLLAIGTDRGYLRTFRLMSE